jgi:thiamine biosynthesis lipoprotein
MATFRSSVEPVLGTRLTMRIDAPQAHAAEAASSAAIAEADRLEEIFSAFRPQSAFCRWQAGELAWVPPELVSVLALASEWHERSGGAFAPWLRALSRRWARAEAEKRVPSRQEMLELAEAARRAPYVVRGREVVTTADCTDVDLHGIAKGWIVDRMVDAALSVDAVDCVLVDVGGDLVHASRGAASSARVAVEDPFAVADNAPPWVVIELADCAAATSGGGRRGWSIEGRWFGHLLDPFSGWPLAGPRSATVCASTAADADALAGTAVVLGEHLRRFCPDAAALVVEPDGRTWRSDPWRATVREVQ